MIHKYLHFARHSLTAPLPHHSTASLSAFFAALHPTSEPFGNALGLFRRRHLLSEPSGDTFALFCRPKPPVGTLRRHFGPLALPCTSHRGVPTTLWPISVTLQVCNQYPQIAQSTHQSHLKRHPPDNDQVTIPGVNIIAHLKVKEPSTVPPIGAPPFQVRNTTRTWNCIYPIIIKLQF